MERLVQDNIQAVDHPANTGQQGQDQVDPKGIIDGASLQVNSQGRNEKAKNDLQNLVIHLTLSSVKK